MGFEILSRLAPRTGHTEVMAWSNITGVRIDGIYRSEGPLRPTQRFFNLQQLASTPENAFSVPVTCDKNNVNAAAFANIASGASYYSVSDGRLEVSLPADSFVSIFVH